MKIPSNVRIFGKEYTIIENSQMDDWGRCRYGTLEIFYDRKQADCQLKDTVLHEVIHAIDYCMQLGLEEKQVHAMASGLYGVFRDNKEFAKWLIKE